MATEPIDLDQILQASIAGCPSRFDLWARILTQLRPESVLEVGVWKGEFAAHVLAACSSIRKYNMIDPWRKLPDWNKPLNVADQVFDDVHKEAMAATRFASEKLVVLRGTTREVVDEIPDDSLDLIYVDGDHTLRGITIDLINVFRKLKPGGYLAGDDLAPRIWQHGSGYEPTIVFPFSTYFAEAVGARMFALPFQQFLMQKAASAPGVFSFVDLVGVYDDRSMRQQMSCGKMALDRLRKSVPEPVRRILRSAWQRY